MRDFLSSTKDTRTAFSVRHLESNSLSSSSFPSLQQAHHLQPHNRNRRLILEAFSLGVAASVPRRIIEKSQNISNVTVFIYDVRSLVYDHELEINKNLVEQMSLSITLNYKTPLLRLFDNHPKYCRLRTYFILQKLTSDHFVVSKYRARNL